MSKQITGCGATTLALADMTVDTIVLCPRIQLVKNKGEQTSHAQMVYADVKNADIREYIAAHKVLKFICTYDGLERLRKLLGSRFREMQIVVDEFHILLNDSRFKVYTEVGLMNQLIGHPNVTWLSATPCLDEILDEFPMFKDVPFYQLHWADSERIRIQRQMFKNPIDVALKIVSDYMQGHFPFKRRETDGEVVRSRECCIFLNSVTNIVNIIRQSGLKPEQVNILCADNEGNQKAVGQLGEGFAIGTIP